MPFGMLGTFLSVRSTARRGGRESVADSSPPRYNPTGLAAEGDMDRDTFTATMRAFRNRTPFRPFTVALVNGDRYEVDRPEILALGEGMAVLIAPGDVPVFFDYEAVSQVIGDLFGRGAETS